MSQDRARGTEAKTTASTAKWARRRPRRASRLLRDLETYQAELECQNRELRDAQLELEESRRRYADLYHFAPVAYLTLDRAGRIREANLTALRFLCVPRELLLGVPLACLVERSDRPGMRDHLRRCLDVGTEVATVLTFVGKRGTPLATQMTSTPLVDGVGKVIGCRTTLTDISALRRTQDRLALLAEVSRLLGAASDLRSAFPEVLGLIVKTFADVALLDLVAEDGILRREKEGSAPGTLARAVAEASPAEGSPQAEVLREGQSIFVPACRRHGASETTETEHAPIATDATASSWMIVPLASRGKAIGVLTLVATERTGRFEAEDLTTAEDLAGRMAVALDNSHLYQQALRATAARDEMLACVAHDLRNPLYAIMLSTDEISEERPRVERRKTRLTLHRVRRNALHISSMVNDLTELSRLESATFQLALAPHDVRGLLNDVVQALLPLAEEKGLALGVEPPVEPYVVCCDSDRIYQVLSNLIGNAVKITPAFGAISIFSKTLEGEVRFSVRDTGPGLSATDCDRMFDKYWQARATTHEGRGLGLYIAKRIVEAHGGTIWCDSELGRGATVSFTLPRTPS